jgi:uncharacterized heparinase superfamily protein
LRLGTLARTLRHVRPTQWLGQVRHRLHGVVPVPFTGETPSLAAVRPYAPFLGPPPATHWDGRRRFRLLEREVCFDGPIDWRFVGEGPLWTFLLHQFHWARDPAIAADVRAATLLDWLERYPSGYGWASDPTSFRAMNWTKLLLTPGALPEDAALRERIARSLAAQIETLAAHLETHLLANHYLTNLSALTLAGLAFSGPAADRWLGHEARYRAQLDEQIGADGAHYERSPMYHAALLEQVLDVWNVARATGRAPGSLLDALRDTAERMLGALGLFTHPDGEIALFGDSAFGFAHPPAACHAYGTALGLAARQPDPPGLLLDTGYVRLEAGPFTLIASVGGAAPAYQPGHHHADALAFELSVGEERVVTDTGVCEYVPGPLRAASRATRSHATLELDGRDQSELWAAHRVGGRSQVRLVSAAPPHGAEGTCRSWFARDAVHRREFAMHVDGVEIVDRVEGGVRAVRSSLPLAPGLEPAMHGSRARLRTPAGAELVLELPTELDWSVQRLPYMPCFGRMVERAALVGLGRGNGPFRLRIGFEA